MQLDKSKRYEFLGDEARWTRQERWSCGGREWTHPQFQHFADRGAVKEVKPEPVAELYLTHILNGREVEAVATFRTEAIAQAAIDWANREFAK